MSSSKSESWGVNSVFLQEKENAQKKEMLKGEIKQEVEEEALEMKEENSTPSFDRLHFIDGSDPLNWQRVQRQHPDGF
ncbi:hypothetical protein SK128_004503 [Halocaridina rubra]|uniref:Uncharacterized protein n=1 Tax=Halocaridina rubra TaxID=373956 RepID=A0AAN8XF84_HALRR